MTLRDSSTGYGFLSSLLHWLITAAVLFMLGLGWLMMSFPEHSELRDQLVGLHISTGVVVLILGLIFITWRATGRRPSLAEIPAWQRTLARVTHICLFAVLVVQPILGVILVTADGHHVGVYGLFQLPLFLPKNHALHEAAEHIHDWLPWFIAALILLHVVAALYHHFVRRDDVLRRMLGLNSSP